MPGEQQEDMFNEQLAMLIDALAKMSPEEREEFLGPDSGISDEERELLLEAANDLSAEGEVTEPTEDNEITGATVIDKDNDGDADKTVIEQDDGDDSKEPSDKKEDDNADQTNDKPHDTEISDIRCKRIKSMKDGWGPTRKQKSEKEKEDGKVKENSVDLSKLASTLSEYKW